MIEITDKLLAVYIPEDATDINIIKSDNWKLIFSSNIQNPLNVGGDMLILPIDSSENIRRLGTLSEISEDDCKGLVDSITHKCLLIDPNDVTIYKKYGITTRGNEYPYFRAKESLISLLENKGVDTSKNLILIEKI